VSEIGYHSMKNMTSSQGIDKANPVGRDEAPLRINLGQKTNFGPLFSS